MYDPNRKPISNFVIGKYLKNSKGNQLKEINSIRQKGEFLKSIGLSLAEYHKLSQVQREYIDSMYNNPALTNNDKKEMEHYYKIYMQKSNNGKREENAVYEQY